MARQRGAAALVVTLMLFFAMTLVALFVNRNLVFEQRSAVNQYRAAQAFEAAEAGLEWAAAQLNANRRLSPDCDTSDDAAAGSFRTRYLTFSAASVNAATGTITPAVWSHDGMATALQPSCADIGGSWSCSCPSGGPPVLAAAADDTPAPAFAINFLPTGRPGLVRVVATGCSHLGDACQPGSSAGPDAQARIEVLLGLLPGLRTPPPAALTLRGSLHASVGSLGLHNPDPATGIAADVGGGIDAVDLRWSGPAGSPSSQALATNDTALAGIDAERLFARHFGVNRAAWQRQPAVTRVRCDTDCGNQIESAVAAAADAALLCVDGDLALSGPLAIGSAAKPVLVVVDGALRLDGAVAFHGMVHARSLRWESSAGGGAFLRGAVVVDGDVETHGPVDVFYDTAVLARLVAASGSFVRVHGSWRDV